MIARAAFVAREALFWLAGRFVQRFLPPAAVHVVLSICGLYCLVTPLLLWIAWSRSVFLTMLGLAGLSCVVFCLVAIGSESPAQRRKRGSVDIAARRPMQPPGPGRRPSSWRDHA